MVGQTQTEKPPKEPQKDLERDQREERQKSQQEEEGMQTTIKREKPQPAPSEVSASEEASPAAMKEKTKDAAKAINEKHTAGAVEEKVDAEGRNGNVEETAYPPPPLCRRLAATARRAVQLAPGGFCLDLFCQGPVDGVKLSRSSALRVVVLGATTVLLDLVPGTAGEDGSCGGNGAIVDEAKEEAPYLEQPRLQLTFVGPELKAGEPGYAVAVGPSSDRGEERGVGGHPPPRWATRRFRGTYEEFVQAHPSEPPPHLALLPNAGVDVWYHEWVGALLALAAQSTLAVVTGTAEAHPRSAGGASGKPGMLKPQVSSLFCPPAHKRSPTGFPITSA